MNYYKKELQRMKQNFEFSLKIYDYDPMLQRTLCVQMMEKVEKFFIPRNFSALYKDKKALYDEIQTVYMRLKGDK